MSTGIIGGKFLERERIQKPDQPRFGTELSEYFTARDLYVGSRLNFHGHYFILIDADEYAFLYMEKQAHGVRVVKLDIHIRYTAEYRIGKSSNPVGIPPRVETLCTLSWGYGDRNKTTPPIVSCKN